MTSDFATKFEAGKSIDSSAYEGLVQSIVDYAVYILSLDGRVVSWNAGAERIKGYSAEEIIGEHFSRFYTPEEVEKGVPGRALKLAREAGPPRSVLRWRLVRHSGRSLRRLAFEDSIRSGPELSAGSDFAEPLNAER